MEVTKTCVTYLPKLGMRSEVERMFTPDTCNGKNEKKSNDRYDYLLCVK